LLLLLLPLWVMDWLLQWSIHSLLSPAELLLPLLLLLLLLALWAQS
jgi:hypothetical protein